MADDKADAVLRWLLADPNVVVLERWLERELPIYVTQAGRGASRDGFVHQVWKLLPTNPEVSWLFGLDGYLDCGDLDAIIEVLWERRTLQAMQEDRDGR